MHRSNYNEVKNSKSSINRGMIDSEGEGDEIDVRKLGVLPTLPIEDRWSITLYRHRFILEHQQGRGATSLH